MEPLVNHMLTKKPFIPRLIGKKETIDKMGALFLREQKSLKSDNQLIVHTLSAGNLNQNVEPLMLEKATLGDLNEVTRLAAAMNLEVAGYDFINQEDCHYEDIIAFRIKRGMYYLYKEDDRVKFIIMISYFSPFAAQIDEGYVVPEYRQHGIATRCIACLCKILFEMGYPLVVGQAYDTNPVPLRYLNKLGFEQQLIFRNIEFER